MGKNSGEKLTVLQGLTYGLGNMGVNTAALVLGTMALKKYCPPEEGAVAILPVMLAGMIAFIAKMIDGVAGPMLGYWSDNTRTRLGRRRPFIIFASLPMCAAFMLVWVPPLNIFPPNSTPLLIYFTVVVISFWLLYTSVVNPLMALLPEIASSDKERMSLSVYQSVFIILGSIFGFVAAPIIKDKFGFGVMGAMFTVLFFFCLYSPVFTIREKFAARADEKRNAGFAPMIATFREALKIKPFVTYIASKFFMQVGFQMVILSLLFIVTTIFEKPDKYMAALMGGNLLFTIASFFGIQAAVKKLDKRRINIVGLALMVALLPLLFCLGRFDLSFNVGTVHINEFAIGIALFALLGFSVATQAVLMSPIIADSTDMDEIETGNRREAIFFSLHGMVLKFGTALSNLFIGLIYSRFGYREGDHLGVDMVGLVAAVFILIGLIVFLSYPIDKNKEEWIRSEVEKLRAEAS